MSDKQDYFNVLRLIVKKPGYSQRQLANHLGFSLGKLNYCLKALKKKGFVKISNFKKKILIKLIMLTFLHLKE